MVSSVLKGLIIFLLELWVLFYLTLIKVPLGTIGPFLLEDNLFKAVKGLYSMSKMNSLARAHTSLSRFILVVSSSDTLLVVSTLDIVQGYHLRPVIGTCGHFLSLEGVTCSSYVKYRSFLRDDDYSYRGN